MIFLNHSGFSFGDSCVYQLIAITHEICNPLDDGLEVRGIFLDISKAFGKVWHKWYLWKPVKTFMLFSILSETTSSFKWTKFILRECQLRGSSRLYFRTIIVSILRNDWSNGVSSDFNFFVDDTSLFSVVNDIQSSAATLHNDLTVISN